MKKSTKSGKHSQIKDMKLSLKVKDLCKGCPSAFVKYMEYAKDLKFDEQPNYEYLLSLFTGLAEKEGLLLNGKEYDWSSEDFKNICDYHNRQLLSHHNSELVQMVTAQRKERELKERAGESTSPKHRQDSSNLQGQFSLTGKIQTANIEGDAKLAEKSKEKDKRKLGIKRKSTLKKGQHMKGKKAKPTA